MTEKKNDLKSLMAELAEVEAQQAKVDADNLEKQNIIDTYTSLYKAKVKFAQTFEHTKKLDGKIASIETSGLMTDLSGNGNDINVPKASLPKTKEATKKAPKVAHKIVVAPFNPDYICMAEGMPKDVPLTLDQMNALLQIPNGVISNLVHDKGELKAGATYNDLMEFVEKKKPKLSKVKSIRGVVWLSTSHVAKILNISHRKLLSVVAKDETVVGDKLVGVRLNKTNIVFFWQDVLDFIKRTYPNKGKNFSNVMLIPHAFFMVLYTALRNDSQFKYFENSVVFGHSLSSDWNAAHAAMIKFDPTIGDFMKEHKTNALGQLWVRGWVEKYHPELLTDIFNLGEKGYIQYLVKYTSYDKAGNLCNL